MKIPIVESSVRHPNTRCGSRLSYVCRVEINPTLIRQYGLKYMKEAIAVFDSCDVGPKSA